MRVRDERIKAPSRCRGSRADNRSVDATEARWTSALHANSEEFGQSCFAGPSGRLGPVLLDHRTQTGGDCGVAVLCCVLIDERSSW